MKRIFLFGTSKGKKGEEMRPKPETDGSPSGETHCQTKEEMPSGSYHQRTTSCQRDHATANAAMATAPKQQSNCAKKPSVPAVSRQRSSLLIAPSPTKRSSSSSTARSSINIPSSMTNSQCSVTSNNEAKTQIHVGKQCSSMPTSTAHSMVASTGSNISTVSSTGSSTTDRPRSLLYQGSKLARPMTTRGGNNSSRGTAQCQQPKGEIKRSIGQMGKGKEQQEMEGPKGEQKKPMKMVEGKKGQSLGMQKETTETAQPSNPSPPTTTTTAASPNSPQWNMEKKPMLAVKGISISVSNSSSSTGPPPVHRRRASADCKGTSSSSSSSSAAAAKPTAAAADGCCPDSPSLAEHRRMVARENVAVGVVSPMLILHEQGEEGIRQMESAGQNANEGNGQKDEQNGEENEWANEIDEKCEIPMASSSAADEPKRPPLGVQIDAKVTNSQSSINRLPTQQPAKQQQQPQSAAAAAGKSHPPNRSTEIRRTNIGPSPAPNSNMMSQPTQRVPKKVVANLSRLPMAPPGNRDKSPSSILATIEEGNSGKNGKNARNGLAANLALEDECPPPSPSVPPPLAPTKMHNLLLMRGETQAFPCISSSSSSSPDDQIQEEGKTTKQKHNHHQFNRFSSASAAGGGIIGLDSTTSQDSLDSVKTAIHLPSSSSPSLLSTKPPFIRKLRNPGAEVEEMRMGIIGTKRGMMAGNGTGHGGKTKGVGSITNDANDGGGNGHQQTMGKGEQQQQQQKRNKKKQMENNCSSSGSSNPSTPNHPHLPLMGGGEAIGYATSEMELEMREQQHQHSPAESQQRQFSASDGHKIVPPLNLQKLQPQMFGPDAAEGSLLYAQRKAYKQRYDEGSSCSSLSSGEPFDDDEISTSDLTTASSSDYHLSALGQQQQKSPEKRRKMEFLGLQQQQQFVAVGAAKQKAPKMRQQNYQQQRALLMGAAENVDEARIDAAQFMPNGGQRAIGYFGNVGHSMGGGGPMAGHADTSPQQSSSPWSMADRKSVAAIPSSSHQMAQQPRPSTTENQFSKSDRGSLWPSQPTAGHFYQSPHQIGANNIFRPYHTITAENWQQIQQQQQRHLNATTKHRRVLSPPHNLMVLSDDGDTLSVAAGDVGGPTTTTATLMRRNEMMMAQRGGANAHNNNNNNGMSPMNANQLHQQNDLSPPSPSSSTMGRHHPHHHPAYHSHSLDRHSHLRLFSPQNPSSKVPQHQQQQQQSPAQFANIGRPFAAHKFPAHLHSDSTQLGSLLISPRHFGFHQQQSSTFAPPPNGPTRRMGEDAEGGGNGRQSSASAAPLNGSLSARCAPFEGGRIYSNLPSSASSSLHLNQQKYSSATTTNSNNSGFNSPNRIPLISSNDILLQHPSSSHSQHHPHAHPGSQLSLASSIGSTYSTIEERYEWEVNKLQSELESYRTTVSLLNQRHTGYNCVLQLFDQRLQTIMHSLGKLQQKRHVKRDEVERLCQEIEHLRVMSISAGVVPNGGGGAAGTNKEPENPPDNPYGNIQNAEGNSKTAKGKTKEKSVERQQQQQPETESQSGTKKSWIRSSFTRAFQKGGSSKKAKHSQQQHQLPPTLPEEHHQSNSTSCSSASVQLMGAKSGDVHSLKRELETKELALTDVQLDALDKAKEIDMLRDTVNRLQHENQLLKYNFTLLERRVRSESRASSRISLNTNCCQEGGQEGGNGESGNAIELDVATMEEHNLLESAAEHLIAPMYDIVAPSPSSGDISVNTTTTGSSVGGGAAEGKSNNNKRSSLASSSGSKNSCSNTPGSLGGLPLPLPSVNVVLCVDFSGRLDNNCAIPPLGPSVPFPFASSQSLASISRANSGSSSTLSSLGSLLGGGPNGMAKSQQPKQAQRRELTIGHLPLPFGIGTNWRELDQQLGLLLEDYLQRIDPDLSLGVDSYSSIIGYQIISPNSPDCCHLRRRRGSSEGNGMDEHAEMAPEMAPAEILQPGTLIRLRLKGAAQHSVDSLVLESLFPRHLLQQLFHQLDQHRRLLLYGPSGIGKSNLARLMAKYQLMRNGIELSAKTLVEIRFPPGDAGAEMEAKVNQAKEQLMNALRPSGASFILLDNLPPKHLATVIEVFQQQTAASTQHDYHANGNGTAMPFIICTLNRTCLMDQSAVQQLQIQHNFRLYALSQKMDAISGYLGRYLRRRMAEFELTALSAVHQTATSNSIEFLVDFLGRSLLIINDFIERMASGGPDVTLGPRILLQCPLDGEKASREWFTQLWNEKLVPYMKKVLSESKTIIGGTEAKGPVEEIIKIWPWSSGWEQLQQIYQ